MSDVSQGPGWWQASDGKWYPPEQHPDVRSGQEAPASTPPPTFGGGAPTSAPPTFGGGAPATPGPFGAPPSSAPPSGFGSYGGAPTGPGGYGPPPGQPNMAGPLPGWTPTSQPPAKKDRTAIIAVSVVVVVLLVGAVVAFLLVGGSSSDGDTHQATPSASPHADVPKGYTEFSDKEDKFSIAVPDTWKAVDPKSADAQRVWDALAQANPKITSSIGSGPEAFARAGMRLLAVGRFDAATSSSPTLNVVVSPIPNVTYDTLPGLISAQRDQMTSVGMTLGELTETKVGGKRAMKAAITTSLKDPSGVTHEIGGDQYYVVSDGTLYIITTNKTDATVDTMLKTFHAG